MQDRDKREDCITRADEKRNVFVNEKDEGGFCSAPDRRKKVFNSDGAISPLSMMQWNVSYHIYTYAVFARVHDREGSSYRHRGQCSGRRTRYSVFLIAEKGCC